jgi:hypothetical protein
MAKISTYDNASPVALDDKVIGTSVGGSPINATKNFLISDILDLATAPTLDEVLTSGNTSSNSIVLTGNVSCVDLEITGNVTASFNVLGSVSAGAFTATGRVEGNTVAATTRVTTLDLEVSGNVTTSLNVIGSVGATGTVSGSTITSTGAVSGVSMSTGNLSTTGALSFSFLPTYVDNAAALGGGLVANDIYKTPTGSVNIVY